MKKWLIAAGLCLAAGAAMLFTPLRFSGGLLIALAAVLTVFGASGRLKSRRLARGIRRFIALCLALGLAAFAAFEGYVISRAKTDSETPAAAVIILGAGVYGTTPSLSLRVRLEAALDYVQTRPDIPIVLSGGQGPGEDISEAEAMRVWLTARGVDESRLILEDRSTSTKENLENSLALLAGRGIYPGSGIAVVSADYHLARAELLFGEGKMIPVAAHMPAKWWPLTMNYFIREAFGIAYLRVFG